jgi:hypothetical protein
VIRAAPRHDEKEFAMTTDRKPWRRAAACLAASIGVALALTWAPGDARATPLKQELRSVLERAAPGATVVSRTRVEWPRQGVTLMLEPTKRDRAGCLYRVCLFEDADWQGRMISFNYRGTYKLANWGMPPTPAKGVSSYWNLRGPAELIGPNFRVNVGPYGSYANVPRSTNDRATYVRLYK